MKFKLLNLFLIIILVTSCGHWNKKLKMMDTNKDGKISKKEWQTNWNQKFTELDANKDGQVTCDEYKKK